MKHFALLLIFVLVLCVGCQNKQKLTGKITFPDGKPLTVGVVFFVTDTYMGRSPISADGTYAVSSEKERDGLPPGNYTVYISGAIVEDTSAKRDVVSRQLTDEEKKAGMVSSITMDAPMKPLIHPKYMSMDTSPLKFTIPGEKEFNFTVETP